jgi:hypothetical protein
LVVADGEFAGVEYVGEPEVGREEVDVEPGIDSGCGHVLGMKGY